VRETVGQMGGLAKTIADLADSLSPQNRDA
jgi:hypothetical protein